MIKRFLYILIIYILAGNTMSCTEDIPDCPSKMCVIAGGWKLTEVFVDDVKETSDFSNYRLVLNMPEPATEIVSSFNRIQTSGNSDNGTWSLENNDNILRLIPDGNIVFTEDWIIENFTPRQLVLGINRNTGIKQGPSKIRFILEPF